jgi:lipopolysaccharide cholinephosphotransferase
MNMAKDDYLSLLHEEILSILDQVIQVCNSNQLKYYLTGGTLLGAVRHNNFIPWDDDLDIVMPREDFEKFVYNYYRQLNKGYSLEWINTNPKYNKVFAKVCKDKTLFEEAVGENTSIKRGIFIDIFPIDVTDGYSNKLEKRKKNVLFWSGLLCAKCVSHEKNFIKKTILNSISEKVFLHLAEYNMKKKPKQEGMYYSNFGSQYSIKKQTHPIQNYGEGVMLPFEDHKYCCPSNYKAVLESIYGMDYMKLPPKDKRRTHYPLKVILSNGQVFEFERTKNRIVVGED